MSARDPGILGMATQLLPVPTQQLDSQCSPPGTHWVCVEVTDDPHIGLCGELTSGRRVGPRATGMCPGCMSLAPLHGASCPSCAEWVARLA